MNVKQITGRRQWQAALFCFILAAATGVAFRLGMIFPLPESLALQNIRHAHSHLMFFGWATPLPLFIFWRLIEGYNGNGDFAGGTIMKRSVWIILVAGLFSFPFFLFYGYHPVLVGSLDLPLSVICSGIVMLGWYGFMGGYMIYRRSPGAKQWYTDWFDASLVLLFICSLGAWGVAVIQALGIPNPFYGKALTHFFLATFTEGWVVMVTLAIIIKALRLRDTNFILPPNLLIGMILVGAPLTFPYGISESLLTGGMYYTARVGGLLGSLSLFIVLFSVIKSGIGIKSIWTWPLVLLFVKALMQFSASVIPADFWMSDHGLRILYLHVLLLGAFTLTGLGFLHQAKTLNRKYFNGLVISVLAVIFSLILLTRIWPREWGGIWIYYVVATVAVLPFIAAVAEWIHLRSKKMEVEKVLNHL